MFAPFENFFFHFYTTLSQEIHEYLLDSVVKLLLPIGRYIGFALQRGKMLSFWRIWLRCHASA
jgi:hypothetical protein